MATKPDYKQVKDLIKQAQAVDNRLKMSLNSQREEIANVRQTADIFYNDKLKSTLESIDVEILAHGKQGIRVQSLKDAGINNIYQLSQMTTPKLQTVNGIGYQSAGKIYSLTQQIADNTKKKLSVRINVDSPTSADDGLIKALYTLICHENIRPQLKGLYDANHNQLQKEIRNATPASSRLKWVFTSKGNKENALNAVNNIANILSVNLGATSSFGAFEAVTNADITECRYHFRENSAVYYSTLEKHCKHLNTEQEATGLSDELLAEIEAQEIDLQYMKATLRGYQTFGVKYAVHQKRTLLGDEMGLGKTIQAIATMAALKAQGKHHFMVVCPASVLINWVREIEKFSTLSVTKVHGADEESLRLWRGNGDVAVTTYESISRFELPEKFKFDMLVVDEAHYVKNPEAQRTVAMQKLLNKTESVLYMSGTPLVNRVDEMCFLVNCLQPEIAKQLEAVKNISTAEQFRQELAPVYLRRVRADVLKELPDLIEKEQWCNLNNQEKAVYREAVESGNLMAIRQVSWQVDNLADSTKAMRLREICEDAKEQGRKIIVFSFFRNTLEKVHELLGDRCMETISGDISPARRQEIVDEFNASPAGAVLVSQVQAGGTGLNIQAASVVIFCEPQLTPAIENQAVSRAYRMGQTSDVLVHRLLADDTIDERMLEILSTKQREFDNFADESVIGDSQLVAEKAEEGSWITKMVKEEQERLAKQ